MNSEWPWLESAQRTMMVQLGNQTLGHAPLVYGPAGVGKRHLVDQLVRAILCDSSATVACGSCSSCRLLDSGTHPDFFAVHPEEDRRQITVDQIRGLNEQLLLTPALGAHRVGLIAPAEAMNKNAANALLKTLEEPFNNVWIILLSHAPRHLLPTIRSRCQKFPVRLPNADLAYQWTLSQVNGVDEPSIRVALGLSAGAPLLALDYLENGHVDLALEVLQQIEVIAEGGAIPLALEEQWAQQAKIIWAALSFWVSELALAKHRAVQLSALERLVEMSKGLDLTNVWSETMGGVELLDSPFRQDLVFSQWLMRWQGLFRSESA